jgi:hypothetical protein
MLRDQIHPAARRFSTRPNVATKVAMPGITSTAREISQRRRPPMTTCPAWAPRGRGPRLVSRAYCITVKVLIATSDDPTSTCESGEIVIRAVNDDSTFTRLASGGHCDEAMVADRDVSLLADACVGEKTWQDMNYELEYAEIGSRCGRDVHQRTQSGLIEWRG